jgi:hypothetical protein
VGLRYFKTAAVNVKSNTLPQLDMPLKSGSSVAATTTTYLLGTQNTWNKIKMSDVHTSTDEA